MLWSSALQEPHNLPVMQWVLQLHSRAKAWHGLPGHQDGQVREPAMGLGAHCGLSWWLPETVSAKLKTKKSQQQSSNMGLWSSWVSGSPSLSLDISYVHSFSGSTDRQVAPKKFPSLPFTGGRWWERVGMYSIASNRLPIYSEKDEGRSDRADACALPARWQYSADSILAL